MLTHFILDSYRSYGGNITYVAIFGYDKMGKNFYRTLRQYPHLGYRSNGIFSFKTKKNKINDIPNLGSFDTFYNNYTHFKEIYISTKLPFKQQKDLCTQNERFSLIRWGSQVDLVLPLDKRYTFDLSLKTAYTTRNYIRISWLVKLWLS